MSFAPGPPLTDTAVRIVLLGSGELGREVAIEALRLGCEVLAVDRYAGAPAMQVAQRHAVIDMTDPKALRALLQAERERPCAQLLVVPELEAIATHELLALEQEGLHVVPTARAARLTMDREGIRRLAAEELGVKTCAYRFCDTEDEVREAVTALGTPCVIKPVMSSSGKGQSVIHDDAEVAATWTYAQEAGRVGAGRVIVEAFVEFDYEITLLTIRHAAARRSARRSVTSSSAATTARAGSRTRWLRPCSTRRGSSRGRSPTRSAERGSSGSSSSCAATRCSSARSPRARTTPA